MAERIPLVLIDGELQQIPTGDTINTTIAPGSGGGSGIPVGGTVNQVLAKSSSTDGDATWVDPPVDGTDGSDGADSTVPGPDGDSAYTLAVAGGFVGTEAAWLTSLEGTDGTDGTDGADGDGVTVTTYTDEALYDAATSTGPLDLHVLLEV